MNILLVTPPLTQLNTPYPATAFLKGFLKTKGYEADQVDLGIMLVDKLFTRNMLEAIFAASAPLFEGKTTKNLRNIFVRKHEYLQTIDAVMRFLRNEDPTLSTRICNSNFLPKASRFKDIADLEHAFGDLGTTDKARHLSTLYLEDITDFIHDTLCPFFSLGRYGERLCQIMPEFAPLEQALNLDGNIVDDLMLSLLNETIIRTQPSLIGFSIPFPGNLYGALKCGQYIKQNYPEIRIAWGGGYVNTELRELTEPLVFKYTDYVLLDDGETALLNLLNQLNERNSAGLTKTFLRDDTGNVVFINNAVKETIRSCTPDYDGLPLTRYISLIELTNPMHKLWSDGRWNKLTLAHGCYWAKCAFCDTSLPYISDYDPSPASMLADSIEAIIKQTGTTGFHFTDEAAPPNLLRKLSEEIIQRNLVISWWTNIRFEKSFDPELCSLMAKAGCIAVSGGIEVASDRVLKLINKGVTIAQAALSANNLTQVGMMVHAYLMYGFPGETIQETLDSLEIVRQMFDEGILVSAFWHRYAMTTHSPSGKDPEKFGVSIPVGPKGSFANNEVAFIDVQQPDLEMLGAGLRTATYNYMHGVCLDRHVHQWFPANVPKTGIRRNFIRDIIRKG